MGSEVWGSGVWGLGLVRALRAQSLGGLGGGFLDPSMKKMVGLVSGVRPINSKPLNPKLPNPYLLNP